jgi:hypothetical protein
MEPDEYPFRYGRPYCAFVWRDRFGASVAPPSVARTLRDIRCAAAGQPAVFNSAPNNQTSDHTIHLSIISMTA